MAEITPRRVTVPEARIDPEFDLWILSLRAGNATPVDQMRIADRLIQQRERIVEIATVTLQVQQSLEELDPAGRTEARAEPLPEPLLVPSESNPANG